MARRKLQNRNVRKLIRLGKRSTAVTLPIEVLRELKWNQKQKVVVKKRGKSVMISDWTK